MLLKAQLKTQQCGENNSTLSTNPGPFIEKAGLMVPDGSISPTDILVLLFTNQLLNIIVFQANRYDL